MGAHSAFGSISFRDFAALLTASKLVAVERIKDLFFDDDNAYLYLFTRVTPDRTIEIVQYVEDDTWPLMPTTCRSLCARLDIDPDLIIGTRH